MPEILETIESTKPARNGEIQLTDALKQLLQQRPMYAYEFEGARYDAGTLLGWLETTITMALKNSNYSPRRKNYISNLFQPDS